MPPFRIVRLENVSGHNQSGKTVGQCVYASLSAVAEANIYASLSAVAEANIWPDDVELRVDAGYGERIKDRVGECQSCEIVRVCYLQTLSLDQRQYGKRAEEGGADFSHYLLQSVDGQVEEL